jgi:hypothetical protein
VRLATVRPEKLRQLLQQAWQDATVRKAKGHSGR